MTVQNQLAKKEEIIKRKFSFELGTSEEGKKTVLKELYKFLNEKRNWSYRNLKSEVC
ncbi:hypothetical protein LCGC14_1363450 [marine sediment metagenome]|uniref:Uncharacterized protein n=1 Tax=marine sediment metagenome TaxID=412755 RepID=A0A0F9K7G2_9ZZZZ